MAKRGDCQHFRQFGLVKYLASTKAGLSVRRLDDETLSRVRIRAAKHRVSMGEEARRILKDAVSAPDCLGDLALRIFGAEHGVDLPLPERTPHDLSLPPETTWSLVLGRKASAIRVSTDGNFINKSREESATNFGRGVASASACG